VSGIKLNNRTERSEANLKSISNQTSISLRAETGVLQYEKSRRWGTCQYTGALIERPFAPQVANKFAGWPSGL
jgi:hypothetical protein